MKLSDLFEAKNGKWDISDIGTAEVKWADKPDTYLLLGVQMDATGLRAKILETGTHYTSSVAFGELKKVGKHPNGY